MVGAKGSVHLPDCEKVLSNITTELLKQHCPQWHIASRDEVARERNSNNINNKQVFCPQCDSIEVTIDQRTHHYTCHKCACNFTGLGTVGIGYKCAQFFSVKPIASYDKMSHVSIYIIYSQKMYMFVIYKFINIHYINLNQCLFVHNFCDVYSWD